MLTSSFRSSCYLYSSSFSIFFFFNAPATTEIYTLSLHDALPIFDYVPLSEVRPAPRNPKAHLGDAIRTSIGRFGVAELPLIDERTGRLVAGHGRIDQLTAMRADGQDPPEGVRVAPDGGWLVPVVRG